MSSRALRKAQKERELLALQQRQGEEESEDEVEEDAPEPASAQKSAFALLGEVDAAESEDEADPISHGVEVDDDSASEINASNNERGPAERTNQSTGSAKKKKKKKKAKKAGGDQKASVNQKPSNASSAQLDEIDAALQALSMQRPDPTLASHSEGADKESSEVCRLLSIDLQELQVSHEMKRLFGRAAFHDDGDAPPPQARVPNGQTASLSDAVSGKYAQGGPGLSAMLRRRNIFVQGKEEWPRATGGGLGMEIVEKRAGGIVEYRFVHNPAYQHCQHEFQACVQAMDPSMMVNMLRFNPYHVSTLLQVSEIAKQERDHATSGELLERALFAFGKSLHSTFAANLALGKARLDFRRFENREFWLAAWRYIANISMRATWRTAYEWARLLLSLDPENDPYRISLIIDRLALRARAAQSFLSLSKSSFFERKWADLPNIHFSQALAYSMVNEKENAAQAVADAVERFPWVASRLFQELEVQKTPPSVWGKMAGTAIDILYTEMYVTLAKDIWKLPESTTFLTQKTPNMLTKGRAFVNNNPIALDDGRHVLLVDSPPLIGLLPHSITSKMDSVSDPLPPPDSIDSYNKQAFIQRNPNSDELDLVEAETPDALIARSPRDFIVELHELQVFFEQLIPGFSQPADGSGAETAQPAEIDDDAIDRVIRQSRISIPEMRRRLARLVTLREALVRQPGQRVASEDGDEIAMTENGQARTTFSSGSSGGIGGQQSEGGGVGRIPGQFDASDDE